MSELTPAQLSDLLESAGYYALPARLATWSRKEVLPALERLKPGVGAGRGAVYGWRDRTVVQQAVTLCAGWEYGGQLDTIKLCAWFAGYEYPVAEMRAIWVRSETRRWKMPLRGAYGGEDLGGDEDVSDVIEAAIIQVRGTRRAKRLPSGTPEQLLRFGYDPEHQPSTRQRAQILQGVMTLAEDPIQGEALLSVIPESYQESWFDFLHKYMTPARIRVWLESIDDELLVHVHHDVSLLAGAYRYAVQRQLDKLAAATSDEETQRARTTLWMTSKIGIRLGRFLMLLNLGLRLEGMAHEVDQTVDLLWRFGFDLDADSLASTFMAAFARSNRGKQWQPAATSTAAPPSPEEEQRLDQFWSELGTTGTSLWAVWKPRLGPLAEALVAADGLASDVAPEDRG